VKGKHGETAQGSVLLAGQSFYSGAAGVDTSYASDSSAAESNKSLNLVLRTSSLASKCLQQRMPGLIYP